MAIFIVLWPYLLTTKLRSVIRHNLGHSKLYNEIRHIILGNVRTNNLRFNLPLIQIIVLTYCYFLNIKLILNFYSSYWWVKLYLELCNISKLHSSLQNLPLKFMFSKKAPKIDEIFTVDLTLSSKCQIYGEDFVHFCGLLRKHELYLQ